MPYAQAFFRKDWNSWSVGYWNESRAGTADAYRTFADEGAALAEAQRYNDAHGPRPWPSDQRRARIGRTLFGWRWQESTATLDEVRDVTTIEQEEIEMDEQNLRQGYSEPERDSRGVVAMMLRDTITGRMMRYLADRGEVTQAEFMNEYHRRCERANPSRSSFGNNFGRFTYGKFHVIERVYVGRDGRPVAHRRDMDRRGRFVVKLRWCGPTPQQVIATLERDPKLHMEASSSMEHMLLDPRTTDDELETYRWLKLVMDQQVEPPAARR